MVQLTFSLETLFEVSDDGMYSDALSSVANGSASCEVSEDLSVKAPRN